MDQLPRLGKRELVCQLLFTCNYVVSVWRGFLFLRVLGMGYVILLWHSLSLPYNYSHDEAQIIEGSESWKYVGINDVMALSLTIIGKSLKSIPYLCILMIYLL